MAQTDRELAEIISNMEAMGWPMKVGHAPDTVVVYPPNNRPPLTINLRTNRGDSKRQTLAAIKRTGYHEAWEQHTRLRNTVGKIDAEIDRQVEQIVSAVADAIDAAVSATTPETEPAVPAPRTPEPLEESVTTATPTPVKLGPTDRTQVNGIKIESRGPAKDVSPADGVERAVSGVEEVLLTDGTIMYQCVRSARCSVAFGEVRSAVSHLRAHGSKSQAARDDAEFGRRSAGTKAGWEARKARQALLVGDDTRAEMLGAQVEQLEEITMTLRELAKLTVDVPTEVLRENEQLKAELEELRVQVAGLSSRPAITEEELASLKARAAKWDAFVAARDAK